MSQKNTPGFHESDKVLDKYIKQYQNRGKTGLIHGGLWIIAEPISIVVLFMKQEAYP
jgi:hypothetical protein